MDFTEFNLHEDLLKGIAAAGYVACTPVQEEVLKAALDGSDLYVQSQTGTGKTAAYLVPIVQELLTNEKNAGKKTLVLLPTRELAVQVEEEAKTLTSGTALKAFSFYGGVGYEKQLDALKQNVDIIIGTPGRTIDLQEGGQLDLSAVGFLVIDEADRMFDMGFYPDLRKLLKVLPPAEARQTMLFSATLNSYVKNLAWEYTRDAKEITIESENVTVDQIDQTLLHVSSDEKMRLLVGILSRDAPESVLIFCNTKRSCEVVSKRLNVNGFKSEFIIGDLPQQKRLKVLNQFKAGKISILVATDVAARGIDVQDLAMVVNYDVPNEAENYVHRIGRTARAGKSGKAYTFCSEQDVYSLPAVERFIEMQIPSAVADEAMLGTDKSSGLYIRTEDWREDYDERDSRRRRGSRGLSGGRRDSRVKRGNDERRDTRGRERKRGDSRLRGNDKSRGNDERRGAASRGRSSAKGISADDAAHLSSMSFDERMKLYKEKYGARLEKPASSAKRERADARKGERKGGAFSNGKSSGTAHRKERTRAETSRRHTEGMAGKGKSKAKGKRKEQRADRPAPAAKKQTPRGQNDAKRKNYGGEKKGLQSQGLFAKIKALFGRKE